MKLIDKVTFTTQVVLERSITPVAEKLGEMESTMELYEGKDGECGIEWDLPSLDETVSIGLELEDGTKNVTGYDGVFELPKQAIALLQKNGFNTTEVE